MDTSLINLLRKFGFTEKEAFVYTALLELGQANVTAISKKAGLKRSIIYVVIGSLLERGVVTEIPNRSVSVYQVVDPSVILTEAKQTIKEFSDMLPYWQSMRNKSGLRPRMHFIEGTEQVWEAFERLFISQEEGYFITSYHRLREHFPDTSDSLFKKMENGKTSRKWQHLIPDTEAEHGIGRKLEKAGQNVRYLPKGADIQMDFAISKDIFAITALDATPSLVYFESPEVASSMRALFDIVWKLGEEK